MVFGSKSVVLTRKTPPQNQLAVENENAKSFFKDSDNDGLPDWEEKLLGTDPSNPDTSGKGVLDGVAYKTQKLYPEMEIHEAQDGFEAGQKITQLLPSLVILDLRLPGMDGLKVCKMIRSEERLKHTKILAISGHHPAESEKESLSAGADIFLGKPFDMEKLQEKLERLLKNKKI